MSWFNGALGWNKEEFDNFFPKEIGHYIRLTADGKEMAILNDIDENSQYFDISDPKVEKGYNNVFYFVFNDAKLIKNTLDTFFSQGYKKEESNIYLYRYEIDKKTNKPKLFMYGFGFIRRDLLKDQKSLRQTLKEKIELHENDFILPVMIYMHKCPVCGFRTIIYKNFYEICPKCRWEDDGTKGEKEESLPNGTTLRYYRKIYLRGKRRLERK